MGSDRGKNRLVHGDFHHVPAPGIGGEATPSSAPRESFEACYCVRPHGVYMSTIKRMVLVLAAVGMVSTQAYAGESAVSTAPLSPQLSTFSQDDINSMFEASGKPMQLAVLSTQEMEKTEGSVAPLVAIGVMTASRFIVQRWVTQRVAQAMIARGATNVWAPSRAIASRIAGRNGIREFHAGSGARYTHFHPNPRNGAHVWHGSPR